MKRFFLILLISIVFVASYSMTAHAEPAEDDEVYGMINLSVNMPIGVAGNVLITLTNTTTNEDVSVMLAWANGNKYSFITKLGSYTLKNSSVETTDGHSLGYYVELEDFTLDLSNPNDNWQWDIVGIVKAEVPADIKPNESTGNSNSHTEDENTSVLTFMIDSNNAYFPNMTIPQIQEWYTKEVTDFIKSGKTTTELNEFQEEVTMWADWVARKNDSILKTKYKAKVEAYDKDDTKDFYAVQKRMYDFLREYYKENGVTLNFDTWTYETVVPPSEPTEEIMPPPSSELTEEIAPTPSSEPTEELRPAPPIESEQPQTENKFVSILKKAWFTLLILVVIIIGGIVWRVKYNKSND